MFSEGNVGASTLEMKEKKKSKTLFHRRTEGLARFRTSTTAAAFSGVAQQPFEAGRYVLIIWRLNDDTEFIINGPHPFTLPLFLITVRSERGY